MLTRRKGSLRKKKPSRMRECAYVWFCLVTPLNRPAGARYGMCGIVVNAQKTVLFVTRLRLHAKTRT